MKGKDTNHYVSLIIAAAVKLKFFHNGYATIYESAFVALFK